MRDILVRAQNYIQIEEATRTTSNRPPRQGSELEKPKPQFPPWNNLSHNSSTVRRPSTALSNPARENEEELDYIPFRVPIGQIFNTIKNQPWSGIPPGSHLIQESLSLATTVPSMQGKATSRWTAGPYSGTCRTWLKRDTPRSSFSITNCL